MGDCDHSDAQILVHSGEGHTGDGDVMLVDVIWCWECGAIRLVETESRKSTEWILTGKRPPVNERQ